jgi:MFS family permease
MNISARAWAVIAATNLAQLPVAMRPLLLVVVGWEATGGFATAGSAVAACAAGLALSAPVAGRLLGRIGDRPTLLTAGAAHLVVLLVLPDIGEPAAFVALAGVAGLATPPVLASGRVALSQLVPGGALTRAYAANSVGQELLYVGGPLLVTACLAMAGPAGALRVCAVAGAAALALSALLIPHRGPAVAKSRAGSALREPGVRTLVSVNLAYMLCMGAMWVLVPAFAAATGTPAQAGLLVTIWSAGSVAGGVILATRGRRIPLVRIYLLLLATLAATSALLVLPRTVPQMAVALAGFGLALSPWLAVSDELVTRVAPAGLAAEAFGWLMAAGQAGLAVGSIAAGHLADHVTAPAGFLLVVAALAAALALALRRRRTLEERPLEQVPVASGSARSGVRRRTRTPP